MSQLPHIPVLRAGLSYASLDVAEIKGVASGEAVVRISQANAGLIKRDLAAISRAAGALRRLRARDRVAMVKRAGEIFLNDTLPLGDSGMQQSPDDYLHQLAATSGLPHALIRRNMQRLGIVFAEIDVIISGLSRGLNLDVLDHGMGQQNGVPVSFAVQTDSLGVILPSTSPAVNALWIPSLALGVPVVLKPGREEPWTPWRMIQAMIKAGLPAEAFSLSPTSHEGSAAIIKRCGRVQLFGDDKTVAQYATDPRVEVHGSGRSKILLGDDMVDRWREFLPVLVDSIALNSGRSCINASAIIVPRHGAEIAEAIAAELVAMVPRAPEDPDARLSGFANATMAEMIDGAIADGLGDPGAEDVSARLRVALWAIRSVAMALNGRPPQPSEPSAARSLAIGSRARVASGPKSLSAAASKTSARHATWATRWSTSLAVGSTASKCLRIPAPRLPCRSALSEPLKTTSWPMSPWRPRQRRPTSRRAI